MWFPEGQRLQTCENPIPVKLYFWTINCGHYRIWVPEILPDSGENYRFLTPLNMFPSRIQFPALPYNFDPPTS